MAEGFGDVTGPEGAGGLVEDGEDAGVVRVLGQVERGGLGGDPVGKSGDGLPGDRQMRLSGPDRRLRIEVEDSSPGCRSPREAGRAMPAQNPG
ncbi:hypothetical protein ACFY20_42070 [Streptomyces sp. NPDC001312]|uniref:hypothetical protein n=1 Tax=Streptomyces sp. NPDC001312 TaxID=3364561 RepID=UPI0036D030AA